LKKIQGFLEHGLKTTALRESEGTSGSSYFYSFLKHPNLRNKTWSFEEMSGYIEAPV
jgi:hypothetical protein